MALFTVTDRKAVMDYIISFTQKHEHIVALVAVGSGAYGYIDELSDLDMVIALDSDEHMEAVMEYAAAQLRARLNFIYFKQIPQRRLQVYLTDNYLEIDIGYGAYTAQLPPRSIGRCSSISRERWNRRCVNLGKNGKWLQRRLKSSKSLWNVQIRPGTI